VARAGRDGETRTGPTGAPNPCGNRRSIAAPRPPLPPPAKRVATADGVPA